MSDSPIRTDVNDRAWAVLEKARLHCEQLLADVEAACDDFLTSHSLNSEDVCVVVVGSVGRQEALGASDLDLIPVLSSAAALSGFLAHDKPLREELRNKLKVKVSQGEDLTKCVSLEELTDQESIGGEKDGSSALTKRILILTEGKQAGGKLPLNEVRQAVMRAYAGAERSRGRHVLSLCNDIARYYRTLCIEYKAKADDPDKDWCTRNMKLRHSRKFWYFSCLMTIVALADTNPQGDDPYIAGLLEAFDKSPVQRLFNAVREEARGMAGRVTEPFAWFLEFMETSAHREKLGPGCPRPALRDGAGESLSGGEVQLGSAPSGDSVAARKPAGAPAAPYPELVPALRFGGSESQLPAWRHRLERRTQSIGAQKGGCCPLASPGGQWRR